MAEDGPRGPWMRGRSRQRRAPSDEPGAEQTDAEGTPEGEDALAEPSEVEDPAPEADELQAPDAAPQEAAADEPEEAGRAPQADEPRLGDRRPDASPAEPAAAPSQTPSGRRTERFAPWMRGRSAQPDEPAVEPTPEVPGEPRRQPRAEPRRKAGSEAPLVASAGAALGDPSRDPRPREGPAAPASSAVRREPRRRRRTGRADDAIHARIRPYKERPRKPETAPAIVAGGRPSTRFRLESDEVGMVFRSGPSKGLKTGIAATLGGMFLIGLLSAGFGISSWIAGGMTLTSLPGSFNCGCVVGLLAVFGCLPCLVHLRRGAQLFIDTGPGRARYKGPSGDVEFPVSFVLGLKAESAAFSRAVCLNVRGRGMLFLFYSSNLEEISRVRDALALSVPALRGNRS